MAESPKLFRQRRANSARDPDISAKLRALERGDPGRGNHRVEGQLFSGMAGHSQREPHRSDSGQRICAGSGHSTGGTLRRGICLSSRIVRAGDLARWPDRPIDDLNRCTSEAAQGATVGCARRERAHRGVRGIQHPSILWCVHCVEANIIVVSP